MNEQLNRFRLLIADDEPSNLRALVETLRDLGEITVATNGREALDRAKANPPDLMLLDINMPAPNGYDICRQARTDRVLKNIPIIFCTTFDAEEDEALGFQVGGADYITKPFSPSIVLARVKTHLELKRHRDHLEALAETRARQLVHSERLATLGTLAAGIAHELNNPLACVMMHADFMLHRLKALPLTGGDAFPESCIPILDYVESTRTTLQAIIDDSDRMARIVAGMRGYAKREDENFKLAPLSASVDNALKLCFHKLKNHVETKTRFDSDLPPVRMHPQQIEQVLINLINNAVDAIEETGKEGLIEISIERVSDQLRLTLDDNGSGIPPSKLETIWDAFFTSKGDKGTGLGLSISRGIIQEHGGNISAQNRPEGGARFVILLPVASETPSN